jgi:hypothetical protein
MHAPALPAVVTLLLLAAGTTLADAPPVRPEDHVTPTYTLANLTTYRARQIQGRVARYKVRLNPDTSDWPVRQRDAHEYATHSTGRVDCTAPSPQVRLPAPAGCRSAGLRPGCAG